MSGLELVSRSTYVCHLVMLPLFDTIISSNIISDIDARRICWVCLLKFFGSLLTVHSEMFITNCIS